MIDWINSVSMEWFDFMLIFTVQNTIFITVVLSVLYLLKNRSARLLKLIALAGLLKLFIPPFPFINKIGLSTPLGIDTFNIIYGDFIYVTPDTMGSALNWPSILMILWISFATALFVFAVINIYKTYLKIKKTKTMDTLSLSYPIAVKNLTIAKSEEAVSPYIIGFRHYYLILPDCWNEWDENIQKSIIAHEIAHIKEGDQWINLFKMTAMLIHFFNPLVWLLIKRLNYFSEVVCDDYSVIANHIPPKEYNNHLITIAQCIRQQWTYEPVLSFSRAHKMIKNRISYQLTRKEGEILKKLTLKTKIIVAFTGFILLLFSWQCAQSESPTKDETSANQTLTKLQEKDGDVYAFFAVDEKPKILNKEVPVYPEEAKKSQLQGNVVVTVTINETGHVIDAKLFKSIKGLDEVSLKAAKKCTFEPAEVGGKKVKVRMNIPYAFRLK